MTLRPHLLTNASCHVHLGIVDRLVRLWSCLLEDSGGMELFEVGGYNAGEVYPGQTCDMNATKKLLSALSSAAYRGLLDIVEFLYSRAQSCTYHTRGCRALAILLGS
jgi:hypothetical protein